MSQENVQRTTPRLGWVRVAASERRELGQLRRFEREPNHSSLRSVDWPQEFAAALAPSPVLASGTGAAAPLQRMLTTIRERDTFWSTGGAWWSPSDSLQIAEGARNERGCKLDTEAY